MLNWKKFHHMQAYEMVFNKGNDLIYHFKSYNSLICTVIINGYNYTVKLYDKHDYSVSTKRQLNRWLYERFYIKYDYRKKDLVFFNKAPSSIYRLMFPLDELSLNYY